MNVSQVLSFGYNVLSRTMKLGQRCVRTTSKMSSLWSKCTSVFALGCVTLLIMGFTLMYLSVLLVEALIYISEVLIVRTSALSKGIIAWIVGSGREDDRT